MAHHRSQPSSTIHPKPDLLQPETVYNRGTSVSSYPQMLSRRRHVFIRVYLCLPSFPRCGVTSLELSRCCGGWGPTVVDMQWSPMVCWHSGSGLSVRLRKSAKNGVENGHVDKSWYERSGIPHVEHTQGTRPRDGRGEIGMQNTEHTQQPCDSRPCNGWYRPGTGHIEHRDVTAIPSWADTLILCTALVCCGQVWTAWLSVEYWVLRLYRRLI